VKFEKLLKIVSETIFSLAYASNYYTIIVLQANLMKSKLNFDRSGLNYSSMNNITLDKTKKLPERLLNAIKN